ncbi:MAG: hypothetical protein BWY63_00145 [Chloroflexi bacterium ADurb.Bin360]|nr:MAG: hypothetical protein BWY63_00145 [Chloroflexi bacterium ADurb.Bin360]
MLRRNVGDLERLLRVILGIYAMLLGFLFISGLVGNLLGFVGLLVFATGATGWCGIYALMGRELPQVAAPQTSEQDDLEVAPAETDAAGAQATLLDVSPVEEIEPESSDDSPTA